MRLVMDDAVSATYGLAGDENLAQRVGTGESLPTLRLYTYRSHCALVGRFQNVENEIHVDYCRRHAITINRRSTGGGAILMGAQQLGVALTIPGRSEDTYNRARQLMTRFSRGLVIGLNNLGVQAEFRRKNDIEVNGRKIIGLGIYRAPSGGLLFHASLLVGLDIGLMLKVLNTPFEKISDKEIKHVGARISTVRHELGRKISVDEVRHSVADGYASVLDLKLTPEDFTAEEHETALALERDKYQTEAWIFQTTRVPDTFGTAKIKTPAGLLDVRATLAGNILKAVLIGGDFFASDNAIADLEALLRWHPVEPEAIAATVEGAYAHWGPELSAIPVDAVKKAIRLAVKRAEVAETRVRSDPYGCFATAGANYG